MNALSNLRKQVLDKRVLPLLLVLLAALIAVPLLLRDKGDEPGGTPTAATAAPGSANAAPVTLVEAGDDVRPRSDEAPLGDPKDPFTTPEPEATPTPGGGGAGSGASKGSAAGGGALGDTGAGDAAGGSAGSGGGTDTGDGGGGSAEPSPTPAPTATPAPEPPAGSVLVRFGAVDKPTRRRVRQLTGLPTTTDPPLVYAGPSEDGKRAIFLVSVGTTVEGDGDCRPTPENCQQLRLNPRDIEFVTVTRSSTNEEGQTTTTKAEYQLELLAIEPAEAAKRAQRAAWAAKRRRLAHGGRLHGLRFDAATGAVSHARPRGAAVTGRPSPG